METIQTFIDDPKIVANLKDEMTQDEYESILDEGWTTSDSFEARMYLSFDAEQKKVYALSQAVQFADNMLTVSQETFFEWFGDRYEYVYAKN